MKVCVPVTVGKEAATSSLALMRLPVISGESVFAEIMSLKQHFAIDNWERLMSNYGESAQRW